MSGTHMQQHASAAWLKITLPIAAIFAFRMLGLFMLIPIFTIYAQQLTDATPSLIGVALGGYGLTQGLLQIPFGLLSDYYGRKRLLTLGLILFALGSLLGMLAHGIWMMIIARVLQGAGAIGSVLIALLADLTRDTDRVKAMAVVGITIGSSFSVAMILSPWLAHSYGLPGVFGLTLLLAVAGLILLLIAIPTPTQAPQMTNITNFRQKFSLSLRNTHLQRLNISIFFQHLMLTSTFFIVPLYLKDHLAKNHVQSAWHFYLLLMLGAFMLMLPFIRVAEKKQAMKPLFLSAVSLVLLSQWALTLWATSWVGFCAALFVYFVAFNVLEAILPSMVSRQAEHENKGTAMGIYSSCQFLGIFAGGLLAGCLFQWVNATAIFTANTILACGWLLLTRHIVPNQYIWNLTLAYQLPIDLEQIKQALLAIEGIIQLDIDQEKQLIMLKIDQKSYQPLVAAQVYTSYGLQ